jgi:hypothetical protein
MLTRLSVRFGRVAGPRQTKRESRTGSSWNPKSEATRDRTAFSRNRLLTQPAANLVFRNLHGRLKLGHRSDRGTSVAEVPSSDVESARHAMASLHEYVNSIGSVSTREQAAALRRAARGTAYTERGNRDP